MESHILPIIWVSILGFIILMYVLLDGFDLGIGALYYLIRNEKERDTMMNSIAPVWDGNGTWLVMGGATLYGAFPPAYSTLIPMLYMPIIFMVVAFIFRGLAFEFRFKADKSKRFWSGAFCISSIIAAFLQGMIAGDLLSLLDTKGAIINFFGVSWINNYSIVSGLLVLAFYTLFGSTWLIIKTEEHLQKTMYKFARTALLATILLIITISLSTPAISNIVYNKWYSAPGIYILAILPLIGVLVIWQLYQSLVTRKLYRPLLMSYALLILVFIGFGVSLWPDIVPGKYTIWQAASTPSTQQFLLIATAIMMPILIAYNAYNYYIFRGKVKDAGYH